MSDEQESALGLETRTATRRFVSTPGRACWKHWLRAGRMCVCRRLLKNVRERGKRFTGRSVVGNEPWRIVVQPSSCAIASASRTTAEHSSGVKIGLARRWIG